MAQTWEGSTILGVDRGSEMLFGSAFEGTDNLGINQADGLALEITYLAVFL